MALQRKILFGQCSTVYSPAQLAYMHEYDWEPMFSLPLAAATNLATCESDCWGAGAGSGGAPQWYDNGFEFWVDLETWLVSYEGAPITRDTATSYYQSTYGTCMSYVESLPGFKGVYLETGFDNGITWLNTRSAAAGNYPIFNAITPQVYTPLASASVSCPTSPGMTNAQDLLWRADHVSEMCFEIWIPAETRECITIGNYLHANRPDMPFGLESGIIWMGGDYYYNGDVYAGSYGFGDGLSVNDRMNVATACVSAAKQQLTAGAFDNFVLLAEMDLSDLQVEWDFFNSLNLGEPATLSSTPLSQRGTPPYYRRASQCFKFGASARTWSPPPPDTFTNTGNEIIMLKSTASASHTVTVTGTHETENYTLALSQNTPAFLGPYPVATFGTTPTITYDNSNLYVSILKDMPV